jgi:ribosomal protein S18 acetylase RimI-like enzyme
MGIAIELRIATAEEFLFLRKLVGWPVFPMETTQRGLERSLFGVCARDENKIVGMGRILGDNAIYFHIQDVIVDPAYQRTGVGKMIMQELMQYIKENAGENANIGLMCSKGREKFYEGYGFTQRPSEKYGAGMIKVI